MCCLPLRCATLDSRACWNALVRAVVQRVNRACVRVGGETLGEIAAGLFALVGVTHADGPVQAERMAAKLANLRLFDDDAGVMNRSVLEAKGGVLVVSQFTLYGDTSRGRRPSWSAAAPQAHAEPLVEAVVAGLRSSGLHVSTGRFGAHMEVELVNDGPVTVVVEVSPAGTCA
jgi:D-tyrosyl-tRNA(Tyr) deacylase